MSPFVGAIGGILAGATGLFVPGMVYLQWLRLRGDILAQALGLSFLAVTLTLLLALHFEGTFQPKLMSLSVVSVIPTLCGILLGQRLRNRFNEAKFRQVFLVALLLVGIDLIFRS